MNNYSTVYRWIFKNTVNNESLLKVNYYFIGLCDAINNFIEDNI